MEVIKTPADISKISRNTVIQDQSLPIQMYNSEISFSGTDNILVLGKGVRLVNSRIEFNGNNSVVFLSESKNKYIITCDIYNDSVFYVGKNCYFNGMSSFTLSEQKHIIIGDDCLFSFDVWARTSDPHLIYDTETYQRQNYSRSIIVGDHVWLGQRCMLLKGVHMGSGSVAGAMALVTKNTPSNCVCGGNPARVIKEGIFWNGSTVHRWTKENTDARREMRDDTNIYKPEGALSMDELDEALSAAPDAQAKLMYIRENLETAAARNRFYIAPAVKAPVETAPEVAPEAKGFLKRIAKKLG